jgi:hypothetical protein
VLQSLPVVVESALGRIQCSRAPHRGLIVIVVELANGGDRAIMSQRKPVNQRSVVGNIVSLGLRAGASVSIGVECEAGGSKCGDVDVSADVGEGWGGDDVVVDCSWDFFFILRNFGMKAEVYCFVNCIFSKYGTFYIIIRQKIAYLGTTFVPD